MIKKLMITMLMTASLLSSNQFVKAEEEKPNIIGEYGVTIDATNGEILYEKNANEKANPASITKIMTAILLDENAQEGEMIKVSEFARTQECSCFVFEPGESISKENALNAMMIVSANDLAMAIGEHLGGTQEEFGKMMTKKAHEIGAKNTTFTTPSGLTEKNHKTTAYDMALIAKEALNHPKVIEAMSLERATIKTDKREKVVVAHGKVHLNPLVIAGKTGFTNAAGHTLVEILEKDGKKVISVVMKSSKEGKYTDISTMAEYAFKKIDSKTIVEENETLGEMKIGGKKVKLQSAESFVLSFNKDKEDSIETKVNKKKNLKQVSKGDTIGSLEVIYDGKIVKEIDLVSNKKVIKVEKKEFKWNTIFIGLLFPIPFYLVYVIRYNKRKRERLLEEKKIS